MKWGGVGRFLVPPLQPLSKPWRELHVRAWGGVGRAPILTCGHCRGAGEKSAVLVGGACVSAHSYDRPYTKMSLMKQGSAQPHASQAWGYIQHLQNIHIFNIYLTYSTYIQHVSYIIGCGLCFNCHFTRPGHIRPVMDCDRHHPTTCKGPCACYNLSEDTPVAVVRAGNMPCV